jgi:SAM-dependent methyltransferase
VAVSLGESWQDDQRRFYDATAVRYAEQFQDANPYFRFVLEHFLGAIAPKAGERILEFGASGGRFTVPLLERGCRVTGVDISARTLAYLGERVASHPRRADLTLVEDDVSALGRLGAADFDAVVGGHILHHVPDVGAVLRQARARVRNGGRVVFVEPNPWNPQWLVHLAIHPLRSWRIERGVYRVWPGHVRAAFLDAGFTTCRVAPFGCFPPFVLNALPVAARVERALERCRPVARLFTLNLFVATA